MRWYPRANSLLYSKKDGRAKYRRKESIESASKREVVGDTNIQDWRFARAITWTVLPGIWVIEDTIVLDLKRMLTRRDVAFSTLAIVY